MLNHCHNFGSCTHHIVIMILWHVVSEVARGKCTSYYSFLELFRHFFFILDHQSGCPALCMMRKFLACILYSVSFPCTLLSWSLHKRFRFIRNTHTYAFTLPFPDPRFLPKRMAGSDLGKRKRKGISICSA